jgi:hypothetical protein
VHRHGPVDGSVVERCSSTVSMAVGLGGVGQPDLDGGYAMMDAARRWCCLAPWWCQLQASQGLCKDPCSEDEPEEDGGGDFEELVRWHTLGVY